MANENEVLFKFGSQAAYDKIGKDNYEDNALYFIHNEATGENRLYKGDHKMAYQQIVVSDSLPATDKAEEGVAYIVVGEDSVSLHVKYDGKLVEVATGSGGGELVNGSIDNIELFNESILSTSESGEGNDKIPTEGFVKESIDNATEDMVEWSHYPEDQNRKAIVLANHDSLTGTMTDGDGANLVMLSKWDVADFGSTKVQMNLNTKSDKKVTVNDHDVVALISEEDYEAGKKVAVVEEGKEIATTDDVDEAIKDALNKAEEDNKFLPKWEELEED